MMYKLSKILNKLKSNFASIKKMDILKFTPHLLIIIASITVCLLCAASCSYIKEHVFVTNSLDNILTSIDKINSDAATIVSNNSINKENALKVLPTLQNKLTEVKTSLSSLDSNNVSQDNIHNLEKGIDNNILLFKQIEVLINNPLNTDVSKAMEDMNNYYVIADKHYNLVINKGAPFSLNASIKNITYLTMNYCSKEKNLKLQKEEEKIQTEMFMDEVTKLTTSFAAIEKNYNEDINKARKGLMDYQLIIYQIDTNLKELSNIKTSLSTVTMPSENLNTLNNFNSLLNKYEEYLNNVKYAIATEYAYVSSFNSLEQKNVTINKDILSLYSNSDKIYKDYEKLKKSFNEVINNSCK